MSKFKKDWHQRSVETLGLSSHRDKNNIPYEKTFVNHPTSHPHPNPSLVDN